MKQVFRVHPHNPQLRLIQQAVNILKDDGVIVFPTDTTYVLGCQMHSKEALERIRRLRQLDEKHPMTLSCRHMADFGLYAQLETTVFRFIKGLVPGPYTFLLPATREIPRRLVRAKDKSIGLRMPNHAITQALLTTLDQPIVTTTLLMPGDGTPLGDPEEIYDLLQRDIDALIDGGMGGMEPTTLIDLVQGAPELLREGKGEVEKLMLTGNI